MKYAIIVYDNLCDDLDEIKQNLIDFTRNCTFINTNLNLLTKEITITLKELVTQDIDYAIVVAAGNFIKQKHFIFSEIIKLMDKEQSPLMCHILEKGGYFHFDPQMFVINLKVYADIGSPPLEERNSGRINIETLETLRSPDNVHDDYTPWWLRSKNKKAQYSSDFARFGIDLIAQLIANGYKILNFPKNIRFMKIYGYPNKNVKEHLEIIRGIHRDNFYFNKDIFEPLAWHQNKTFYYFSRDIKSLLHVNCFYPVNTEPLVNFTPNCKKFDCFIGVCGGIKPALLCGSDDFDDNAQVLLLDYQQAAIDWQKYLVEQWSGDINDIENVFAKFMLYNQDYKAKLKKQSIVEEMHDYLKSNNLNREEVSKRWQKFKKMNISYKQVDLMQESAIQTMVLFEQRCDSKSPYLWLSNVFIMDYTDLYYTRHGMTNKAKKYFSDLHSLSKVTQTIEWCCNVFELDSKFNLDNLIKRVSFP